MKKILLSLLAIVMGLAFVMPAPVYAAGCTCADGSEGVPTSILGGGCVCDDGKGSSIRDILNLVVDIMTIGIGILGVVGISIVGIQYLTAGGSEEKTRKAKRRLFEIVIGLVAYAVIYFLLKWLLPSYGSTDTAYMIIQGTNLIV